MQLDKQCGCLYIHHVQSICFVCNATYLVTVRDPKHVIYYVHVVKEIRNHLRTFMQISYCTAYVQLQQNQVDRW